MNSKINTVLLVIVILLLGAGFWVVNKKPTVITPTNVVTPSTPVAPITPITPITPGTQTPAISGDAGNFVSFSIAPGATVSGVMKATGSIKGGYFFEANMGVKILDANKNVLKSTNGTATSEWMTGGPVSFTTTLNFTGIPAGLGYVRLHNDNPSGMPENDKFIDIPVVFQ